MNRKEFMEQLEQLLMDIPQEERQEALTYYNGYFEDAGEENEAGIIQELESPRKVARIIKADMGMDDEKEYTEAGFEDTRFRQQEEVGVHTGGTDQSGNGSGSSQSYDRNSQSYGGGNSQSYSGNSQSYDGGNGQSYGGSSQSYGGNGRSNDGGNSREAFTFQEKSGSGQNMDKTTKTVLLILLAVVTSPLWLGILGAAAGLILGVFGTVLGVLIAAAMVVLSFYIAAFVLGGVGISMFVGGGVAAGLGLCGVGILMLALAILGTVCCVWLFGRFLPWLVRKFVELCGRLFCKRGKAV